MPEDDFWIGFGNGTDGAVSIEEDTVYTQPIQATTFVLNQNITLSTTRKTPIVIKATQSITVNGTISADGKGYTYQEDNNYFNLSYSTQNVQGSIGISGGGSSGASGRAPRGGQPVSVTNFLQTAKNNYKYILEQGIFLFPVFGGGGGCSDLSKLDTFSTGGGCVVLSSPIININGSVLARGLPGAGASWNGNGGGGGGLILLVSETLNADSATFDACGGGGGGGAGKITWLKVTSTGELNMP